MNKLILCVVLMSLLIIPLAFAIGVARFHEVRLLKDGVLVGDDQATATEVTTTETNYSFGGSSNLWGTTWTPAEINAEGFGVVIAGNGTGYTNNYITHYLNATNFTFSIPGASTINGITLTVEAQRTGGISQYINMDFVSLIVDYSADDTCTAPGSSDWEVDCSDNCDWNSPQDVPGNVYMTGSGKNTLSSTFTFTGSNQIIAVGSGCTFEIISGGQIG